MPCNSNMFVREIYRADGLSIKAKLLNRPIAIKIGIAVAVLLHYLSVSQIHNSIRQGTTTSQGNCGFNENRFD